MPHKHLSPADAARLQHTPLREVADALRTTPEHVRQLCIRYEQGHDDGIECVEGT
jgi:hypothetical protein